MSGRQTRKGPPKGGLEDLASLRERLPSRPQAPTPRPAPPAKVEPALEPSAPPAASEDPDVAFAEAMGDLDVAPLTKGAERVSAKPEGTPSAVASRPPRRAIGPAGPPPSDPEDAVFEEGLRELLAVVRLPRSRRATEDVAWPVLDLHGFAEADALHETRKFVSLHRHSGSRMVRLITGRGRHGDAVIRPAIERWLGTTEDVASWRWGTPAEGGAGAMVLNLRRSEGR